MKKIFSFVTVLLLTVMTPTFAATVHYTIFVDAGSTGSRLHIFQYEPSGLTPLINDVFSESVKPGLSSFSDHPESAGASLKPMLDDAVQFLQKNGVEMSSVPLNVFGTAGMRLLPKNQQQAIYQSVTDYLKNNNYSFAKTGDVKTIPGKMEGFYGWLDVNYLLGNFQQHKKTVGSIDMGGASTQIAFRTDDYSQPEDEISVTINHKDYTVFSKSFLGLGEDQARGTMTTNPMAYACYPKDYAFDPSHVGNFDFVTCGSLYSNMIEKQHVRQQLISSRGQSFIAYSGIFYTYQFFNADKMPTQSIIENAVKSVCYESWQQLQTEHPTDKYLNGYCANAMYQDQLLYATYRLQGDQLTVTSQINQKDIDWTLGAALYSLVK